MPIKKVLKIYSFILHFKWKKYIIGQCHESTKANGLMYIVHVHCTVDYTELGTQQFCRNNVTMLSGHKVVCICHFTIFIVATPSRHWGPNYFSIFFWSLTGLWGYINNITLSRCRIVIVAKLKDCRVPSSDYSQTTFGLHMSFLLHLFYR